MDLPTNITNSDVDGYYLKRALWPAVVYTVLLMTVGTFGNILVLVVYRRQYRKSVTRMFIFALAALDIGNCLITMPTELVILIRFTSFPSSTWCKITRYMTYIFNGTSSIILIAIALDRYFKVCRPTHQGIDVSRAKVVCYGSFLLAALLSIPALVIYGDMVIPVLVNGDQVSMLPFDTPLVNTSTTIMHSDLGSQVIISGTFCLLTTDYIDSLLPTFFYIGMMCLYLILIFFVIFFYSQVAKTMFVLTRKHSQMFSFYNRRSASTPNSAVPEVNPVSYNCAASNVVIREASTFDEDGPYEQCDQLDQKSTVENSHMCEQDSLSRLRRQNSKRTFLSWHHSMRAKDPTNTSSLKSKQHSFHNDLKTNAIKGQNNVSADEPIQMNGKESLRGGNPTFSDRDKAKSEIINVQGDVNSNQKIAGVGSKKFRKSYKIPQIKIQDTSKSTDSLVHTASMNAVDVSALSASSNSLLLRRFKSAENVNSLTRLNKLQMPDARRYAPVFPDFHEDLLPKNTSRKQRREKAVEVGHVTKSCLNLDFVGGEEDKDNPQRAGSEKTLTLTKKTSPQGKKKICVIPLTGLSSKTALMAQDSQQGELNNLKGSNLIHSSPSEKNDKSRPVKSAEIPIEPSGDHLNVTLRPKSPDVASTGRNSHASTISKKSQDGAKNARSPRQEIVSTADILQEHHNRGSLHPFRTSRMLFTISLVFVISFLPFFIVALVRSSIGSTFLISLTDAQLAAVSIFIRSSLISNAVNPIIYGLLSSHFRRECTGLVCCLFQK